MLWVTEIGTGYCGDELQRDEKEATVGDDRVTIG
jgi:hypothetical protein